MLTLVPMSALPRRHSKAKMGANSVWQPGTRVVSALAAAAQTLQQGEQIVNGNPGTRVPVSAGTRVPGSTF